MIFHNNLILLQKQDMSIHIIDLLYWNNQRWNNSKRSFYGKIRSMNPSGLENYYMDRIIGRRENENTYYFRIEKK